jgi:selenide,water dikinase
LLEICRGSASGARVTMENVPLMENVLAMAQDGLVTGASSRNWRSYGANVRLAPQVDDAHRALLCDPQTSGGLLIACAHDAVSEVMETFRQFGCAQAQRIGDMIEGAPRIEVDP